MCVYCAARTMCHAHDPQATPPRTFSVLRDPFSKPHIVRTVVMRMLVQFCFTRQWCLKATCSSEPPLKVGFLLKTESVFSHFLSVFLFFLMSTHCRHLEHLTISLAWHQWYGAHEQDLSPRIKWARLKNEILSPKGKLGLGPFRSNIHFGKCFFQSSSREAGYFSPRGDWSFLCRV